MSAVTTAIVVMGPASADDLVDPRTVLLSGGEQNAVVSNPASGTEQQMPFKERPYRANVGPEPPVWAGREMIRLGGTSYSPQGERMPDEDCPVGFTGVGDLDEQVASDDGRSFATVSNGRPRDLSVVDCSTGVERRLAGDGGGTQPSALWKHATWSPDGGRVFALDVVSGDVAVWDRATGELLDRYGSGLVASQVRGMDVAPDGRRLALVTVDDESRTGRATARLHVLEPGARPIVVDRGGAEWTREGASPPAWSPNGDRIGWWADGTRAVEVSTGRLWPSRTGSFDQSRDLSGADGFRGSWSNDGRWFVVGAIFQDSGCHCDVSGRTSGRPFVDEQALVEISPRGYAAFAPGVVRRHAGRDRARTAIEVSGASSDRASDVVLARQDAFPDALAGGPLAARLDAPLLLTSRDALLPAVADEVRRLGAERVHVLGSEAALSSAVVDALEDLGVRVVRHAGRDRFATAAATADALLDRGGDASVVHLAKGVDVAVPDRAWPDALAASALAGLDGSPLLLTAGDQLPPATRDWLRANAADIDELVVAGGAVALSDTVADVAADAAGARITRLEGDDRFATSVATAQRAIERGADPQVGWLAIGTNWPDALAAAPAAARAGGWLALVPPAGLRPDEPVLSLVDDLQRTSRIDAAGGADVLSPAVTVAIERRVAPFPGLP